MTQPDVLLKRGGVLTIVAALALGWLGWRLGRQNKAQSRDLNAAYTKALQSSSGSEGQQLDRLRQQLDTVDSSLSRRLDSIDARLGKGKSRSQSKPSRSKPKLR
ncbi:MAG TPA: hypothetical protein VMH80_20655 [Bryobacteraceae bacterium]|nr:hypothetical protein [Bryobacteraceae bacterium]